MATKVSILFLLFFIPFIGMTQTTLPTKSTSPEIKGVLVETVYYDGDTIPYGKLPVVTCSADRVFKNYKQRAAWDRLKYNVKKVYPYAILASAKLKDYDRVMATIPTESGRKAFMKQAEKDLKNEFQDELKNLTVTQGRILIKLIDRETGKTTYDIVKCMRGSFSAAMWQGVALVFNSSLKSDYDADGDEKNIEMAIKLIEDGQF
ncbi:MAG: DUF4294 domain-containing protein [Bacteroidetes bacterium]|nr:DUF4294 domain-containing protein [Bacteroidota bacterium]